MRDEKAAQVAAVAHTSDDTTAFCGTAQL